MGFELLKVNLVPKYRTETLEGRQHWVFNAVALKQGVHSGSQGPCLYELTDMTRFIQGWNTKPVMNYHPKDSSGNFVSASDPVILSSSKIGLMLNNRIEGDKHHLDVWLDVLRMDQVDPRLKQGIQRGITFEVSTGLFTDNEEKEGVYNGKPYKFIARNYRPDHLAVLPDQVGACSVADGCGLFTAAQAVDFDKMTALQDVLNSAWKGEPVPKHNCSCKGKTKELPMEKKQKVDSLIASKEWEESDRTWLEGLEDSKLDRMVKSNTDKTKAIEDAEKKGKEAEQKANEKKAEDRKKKVDALIASELFEPGDREYLEKQSDEKLDKIFSRLSAEPVKKNEPKTLKLETVEDIKNHTSGPLQEMLLNGLNAHAADRKRHIDTILSNKSNQFTKEELEDEKLFNIDRLRKLSALSVGEGKSSEIPSYGQQYIGNAGAPPNSGGSGYKPPTLDLPTFNVKKEEAKS